VKYSLLAGDSTLVALYSYAIQTLVTRFANAAKYYNLKINIKKTECLYQPANFENAGVPCYITRCLTVWCWEL